MFSQFFPLLNIQDPELENVKFIDLKLFFQGTAGKVVLI